MTQILNNSRRYPERKLSNCPKKSKDTSLDSWISEVKMWNESNSGEGFNLAQKYLNFIESVRNSEGSDDLKKFVEVNVVENRNMNKSEKETIEKIVKLIEDNLGKSDLEKSTGHWTKFINIKQETGESIKDFATKFEQAERGLLEKFKHCTSAQSPC